MSKKSDVLFGTMSKNSKQVLGLVFGILASICLMVYKVPKHGAWLPRWAYGPLNFVFGSEIEWQARMIGVGLAIVMFVFLCHRGFIDSDFIDNPISIACTMVNIWGFGLVFNIIFGDLGHVLDGGLGIAAVAAYSVATMGMKQYMPIAFIVLAGLAMVNVMAADAALAIQGQGAVGVLLMFMSLILQYKNFVENIFGKRSNKNA